MRHLTGSSFFIAAALLVVTIGATSGCSSSPRDQYVQWVARDQWDSTCAQEAIVESFKAENGHWKIKDQVWAADVTARFKLVNACTSGLPGLGKQYKQFEGADLKATVEMSSCVKDGEKGWSLVGKESTRCWTGPTLVATK